MFAQKVPKNAPGTPRTPIFCLIGLYQACNFSATEFRSFSNLRSGGQRYSACRPLKGGHVSLGFSPGVRRTSVFAKGENLGARRNLFPPRKSNLSGSPDSPQDWLGGIQRGAFTPLCVVAGVGFIGEGPHRKGPAPMRVFGYFLHEQKVTRGVGLKAPSGFGKKHVSLPPGGRRI